MSRSGSPSARRRGRLRKFGWRWRRNSLRRRTDVVETWLGVLTTLLFCLAPAFGWWAGQSVDRTLQRVVRTQRSERYLVTATLAPAAKASGGAAAASAASAAASSGRTREKASDPESRPAGAGRGDVLRWTAPDHSTHTSTVSVDLEVWHRGRIQLWTDRAGRLVPPPLDAATAATHSVLAGTAAAASAAGLVLIVRQVLMWRLMRRRLDGWAQEWARVGQDWGRAGAGG
ncbi:hypothetical protein [Streptomyces sp. NBC_01190]|uniref:Rv1733c family protein n=1 Tax=Streptomyces sp. NBC_01190 TaxID=2903767 RepID=UPI00386A1AD0|nr:hypothetical protein OG519_33225 [Streptomyces sp. NBC_01190]